MTNINTNTVTLMNAGGREKIIGDVPDLWHIVMELEDGNIDHISKARRKMAAAAILETWHMAHDLKDAISADRKALILEIK